MERKEKVDNFQGKNRCFPREENIGKIPTFSRGKKNIYYYIIYIFGLTPPENLF